MKNVHYADYFYKVNNMNPLIQYYSDYFSDENKDGYRLLCSSVCVNMLNGLYLAFVRDGIPRIEDLEDKELKTKFWDKAKEYQQEHPERVKAYKAAYVLSLITSTE